MTESGFMRALRLTRGWFNEGDKVVQTCRGRMAIAKDGRKGEVENEDHSTE